MGTIKTTVKLETNALPFPVNYTTSVTNVVVASNYARVSILDDAPVTLSNIQFGTEGGFLYAQSPITNTFGTTVNIWLVDVNGDREIATLNPGEAILLPLSSSQHEIYATTNLGKIATLDYQVSDKGGKWGQSTLVLFNNYTNWKYSVIDVNVNQTPTLVDTGYPVAEYILSNDWVIQDKGYVLEFIIDGNGDGCYIFVDSRGNAIPCPDEVLGNGTGGYDFGGKSWARLYNGTNVVVFDGDRVHTHSFNGASSIWIDDQNDYTTSDGSFIIYAIDYDGIRYTQYIESNILINGENRHLLTAINYNSGPTQYQYAQTYVYQFANFVVIKVYNDDSGQDLSYKIFDTTGVLLQDLDVSSLSIDNTNIYLYGDNTVQLILHSTLNGGRNYMFNYNHELNRFLGKNFEWSVDDRYNYHVSNYYKSLNYGFKEPYEPNGIVITFYTSDNYSGWAYLNQYSTDCQIHYLVEGMDTYSAYIPNKPIWFQRINYVTRTNAFFVWGNTNGLTSTPIKLLTLNSSLYTVQNIDANSVTLLPDFKTVHIGNGHVGRYPAGNEYLLHDFRQQEQNDSYVVIAKKGLVRTLNMTNAEYHWVSGYNSACVTMGSENYGSTSFYFDFKQNTFVNINSSYWPEFYPGNYGTYNNNDVKAIASKMFLFNYDSSNIKNARALNGSTITPSISLPYSGSDFSYYLGYDFIAWMDFQPSTQSWVIYIYDTDLTLISSYNTGFIGKVNWWLAGNRMIFQFYDGSNYHYLWVSKKGVVSIPNEYYYTYIFNDYPWWND